MKFRIRYADQIVGLFIVIALVSTITVVFMLGKAQRWFSRNYYYVTYAESASGLSKNMPINFRGFSIGNVKSFDLTDDDRVEIIFTIQDKYNDRVKQGSLVDILVSPIGLGNQFIFHPGLGSQVLDEYGLVPMINSDEGKAYLAQGIGYIPPHEDSIAVLMGKINTILDDLHDGLTGNEISALGATISNIERITAEVESGLSSPDGIMKLISGEGDAIASLEAAFVSLAGTLDHIEKATSYLPREMPQINQLLSEARNALQAAEDVLVALRNNPLLRNGIPEHAEIDSSGNNPRDLAF